MYRTAIAMSVIALLSGAPGCGSGDGGSSLSEMERLADEQEARDIAAAKLAAEKKAEAEAAAEQRRKEEFANQDPSLVTTDDMKRGKDLKGGGYLTTVMRGRVVAEQRLNLDMVTHALNLYWASEGDYPKSHEEFMEKVIEFNQITLPELDGDYEYWYNPEDHQLYKRPVVEEDAEVEDGVETEADETNPTD
ncbi:hypothetical protein Mal64_37530 [Pseudobythopirellula maris]|uniref:Uncharacterized protein n=1 Tax=Pseudobythopirellula maris TaxID=2527991 RepID=A0A5C5ZKH7_9BACT|nr:hypothetical protein [Pseudobythopirellula maris]TWT86923.1 hypothetical protein Mal64_37530 [Pseudobythopirellula maris]